MYMEFTWKRVRDEQTTEIFYECIDPVSHDVVAVVNKVGKGRKAWRCSYRGYQPFHRSSAKKCMNDYAWIINERQKSCLKTGSIL